jgi:hypothetical protein
MTCLIMPYPDDPARDFRSRIVQTGHRMSTARQPHSEVRDGQKHKSLRDAYESVNIASQNKK